MAAVSDSDDSSDIFWPGYVDAVTNLAINLLFVIAILSIVVLTTNLQIGLLEGKKNTGLADEARMPGAGYADGGKSQFAQAQQAVKKALDALQKLKAPLGISVHDADASALIAKQIASALKTLQTVAGMASLQGGLGQGPKAGGPGEGLKQGGPAEGPKAGGPSEDLTQGGPAEGPQEGGTSHVAQQGGASGQGLSASVQAEIGNAVSAFEQLQKQFAASSPEGTQVIGGAQQLEKVLKNIDVMLQKQIAQQTKLVNAALSAGAAKESHMDDKLEQLQRQLTQAQEQLKKEQALRAAAVKAAAQANEALGAGGQTGGAVQEFKVQERSNKVVQGTNKLQDIGGQGGVVVVFANDVIELSDSEAVDLVRKLSVAGAIKNVRWELRVISPKGFSEAARIAYYRLNSLRNVLLKNGVNSADIDMRVLEAESGGNNARVLVKPAP